MKRLAFLLALAAPAAAAPPPGDYVEHYDSLYNSLTVEKHGSVVELRARSRRGEFLESAVDLADPLRPIVGYTRSLYGALFLQPQPRRVLMIGLGGAGFPRLFTAAFPDAVLHTVELDPKVAELCRTRLGFTPTERTPVTIMDGRLFVKRDPGEWDWIILDAYRGGFVPPHLKSSESTRLPLPARRPRQQPPCEHAALLFRSADDLRGLPPSRPLPHRHHRQRHRLRRELPRTGCHRPRPLAGACDAGPAPVPRPAGPRRHPRRADQPAAGQHG